MSNYTKTSMNDLRLPVFPKKFSQMFLSLGLLFFAIWQYHGFISQFQAENTRYTQGICCGFTEPVFDHIFTFHTITPVYIDYIKGYASIISAYLFEWQGSEANGLLWISELSFILSMFLCYLWGVGRKKPLMGAFAAYIFSVTPILFFNSLRWDVFILCVPVILLALIIAPFSRGFTKILPTVLFCGLVWCAAFWSSRETDNFLLLLSIASIAFGSWLQILWKGRDQKGWISRRRSFLMALTACAIILFLISRYTFFTSPEGAYYYFREAEQTSTTDIDPSSWTHVSAYWGHLYWRGLGSSWALIFGGSLIWGILKRKLDWSIGAALFFPFLFLSLLSKKNFYYLFGIWGLIPLVIGVGVYHLPRWGRWVGMIGVIWWGQGHLELRKTGEAYLASNQKYGGIFQTSDQGISFQPRQITTEEQIASILITKMPEFPCEEARWIANYAPLKDQEIEVRIKKKFPCTIIKRFPKMSRLNEISVFFIRSQDLEPLYRESLKEGKFESWGRVPFGQENQIEIWGKSVMLKRNVKRPVGSPVLEPVLRLMEE